MSEHILCNIVKIIYHLMQTLDLMFCIINKIIYPKVKNKRKFYKIFKEMIVKWEKNIKSKNKNTKNKEKNDFFLESLFVKFIRFMFLCLTQRKFQLEAKSIKLTRLCFTQRKFYPGSRIYKIHIFDVDTAQIHVVSRICKSNTLTLEPDSPWWHNL